MLQPAGVQTAKMPQTRPALLKQVLQRAAWIWTAAWGRHDKSTYRAGSPQTNGPAHGDVFPAPGLTTKLGRAGDVLSVLRAAGREYEQDYARYFAVAMIYYALVSLVPFLLLLMTSIGWLLRLSPAAAEIQQSALEYIETAFGSDVESTVSRLAQHLEQQSIIPLSVSLVGLLVTASVFVAHLQLSFRAIWRYPAILFSGTLLVSTLRMLAQKLLALLAVVGGGVVLLLAFISIASVNWLARQVASGWAPLISAWPITVPLIFALMFRFFPPRPVPWRHVWVAALLCGAVWLGVTELLALFGSYFGKNLSTYGAFGTVLAAMVWMNIVSQCVFFGAELCKVLTQNGWPSRRRLLAA
jgi:membrane protein